MQLLVKKLLKAKIKAFEIKIKSSQTETELIKYFNTKTSIDLYFRFGTGAISNTEIKEFVRLKKRGWYQTIKNKIYGPSSSCY